MNFSSQRVEMGPYISSVSRDPSGDRVMPPAEVRVRAQASHGNITVLSHFK